MMTLIYLSVGALSGLLAGLLGLGGGIILVPALLMIFKHGQIFQANDLMHMATGTSLLVVLMGACSSSLAYYHHRVLIWPLIWRLIPGLIIGTALGFILTHHLSDQSLRLLFAGFMLIIALKLLIKPKSSPKSAQQTQVFSLTLAHQIMIPLGGLMVGLLSVLLGLGGGILMIPLFLMLGLSMRQAAGNSVLSAAITAGLASLFLAYAQPSQLYSYSSGYIYWPAAGIIALAALVTAPLGTSLAFKLPISVLERIFALLLCCCSLKMMVLF